MGKETILKTINGNLPFLRSTYHVKKIGLFGSAARGDDNKDSDVDILVDFDAPIGFFDFIRLEKFLSEILGKKVDLVSKEALKPFIRNDVLKELIYV